MRPVIFDAERRPREWSRRVSGLGGDRSRVVYLEPADLPPAVRGQPLWDCAEAVGAVMRRAGGDLLLVDSVLPASAVGEERLRSDPQVPFLYAAALDGLQVPSLSFGHPPKGQPDGEPFGSFAWTAAMRLTWSGTRAEGDGHRLRWRPRKRNERGHIPGILLTFQYGDDHLPHAVTREDDDESTRDWVLGYLAHGPASIADMAEDVVAQMDEGGSGDVERVRERLKRACYRMTREGWLDKLGTRGRGVTYRLRER
jgi:hypothetical protein